MTIFSCFLRDKTKIADSFQCDQKNQPAPRPYCEVKGIHPYGLANISVCVPSTQKIRMFMRGHSYSLLSDSDQASNCGFGVRPGFFVGRHRPLSSISCQVSCFFITRLRADR